MGAGSSPADCILKDLEDFLKVFFLCNRKLRSYYIKNAPLRMRTAAYNVGVASDRRRRENVPRHILYRLFAPENNLIGDKSLFHIYDALVFRASELKIEVLFLKNKWSVNEDIYI